jgi:hypothetical protein
MEQCLIGGLVQAGADHPRPLSLALFIVVRLLVGEVSVLGYRPLERVVVEPEVRQADEEA